MTRISIELVPRNADQLTAELSGIYYHFPHIHTINIPDLLRFDIRSWEGCAVAKNYFPHAIPHIRAIDFSRSQPFPLMSFIREHHLNELLIVSGDPPPAVDRREDGATCLELIEMIKREMPEITIYAAIDPYRNGIQEELEYVRAKQAAGADGFFTQPFFDVRLMEIFYDQLPDLNIYWGVSPVLTAGSKNYWVSRNRAIFPSSFEPTMAWNQRFGREALQFAQRTHSNIYFMPIRANVVEYLKGVFVEEHAQTPQLVG